MKIKRIKVEDGKTSKTKHITVFREKSILNTIVWEKRYSVSMYLNDKKAYIIGIKSGMDYHTKHSKTYKSIEKYLFETFQGLEWI